MQNNTTENHLTSNSRHSTSNDLAISLKNVSKYYKLYDSPKDRLKEALSFSGKTYHKKFYATKNLDLEIKKGEILGIVGKNGSGKSTLLKLITGVLTPDEGSIKVNGKISALLELGSGFNPEFTGMQNIFFYGTILGFSKKEMEEKLDNILAFADIGDFINQPLKTYSSGMKSRLGFAVAVHIEPEILILDEVLAVGDVLFKRKCYAKMEEFFKSGKTIIYVSHDANSVNQLCSRAIFLDKGSILLDSDANTVTKHYQKYIFSTDNEKEKIKDEILSLSRMPNSETAKEEKTKKAEQKSNKNLPKNSSAKETAFFMPGFKPKSTVEYKNYDVKIIDPHITKPDGTLVNVLLQDEQYKYCYKVKFGIDTENVSFGMQIKDEKGFVITSTSLTQFEEEIPFIKKGEEFDVVWDFTCNLLPATYYLNAGSSCLMNNERHFLHRIVDATCFKVISRYPKRYGGIVHLGQSVIVRNIND